jgi:hypothetical protein
MSVIAGIDASTLAIDIVLLDEDSRNPTWTHCPLRPALEDGSRDDLRPSRSVRDALPGRSGWEDQGVTLVAIEDPYSASLSVSKKLARVIGAVSACLPAGLPVLLVTPVEMRQWLGIQGRLNKEQLRAYAVQQGAPEEWAQDAHDAYVVALAALERIEHELRRAAA